MLQQAGASGGSRAGCINASQPVQNIPQGLKPQVLCAFCGTAKAVPFQNPIYATISSLLLALSLVEVELGQLEVAGLRNLQINLRTVDNGYGNSCAFD